MLCILCFTILLPYTNAYEFVNPSNEGPVLSDRRDIYSLKKTYDELAGTDEEEYEIEYQPASSDKYWWPIGSSDTTTSGGKLFATGDPEDTTITSYFGYRGAVIDGSGRQIAGNENHGALDIANYRGTGVTNIIAAKSGAVVFPTDKDKNDCKQYDSKCTGYGNYVIIQHSDGNYTLYGHLDANSITVKAGDSVEQGQVIGKMGTSGNSTGPHLHFEVRLGENTPDARVDPLDYIDKDNPRPSGSNGNVLDFIASMEGTGPIEGDYYIAYTSSNDSFITIGYGVTWENNIDRFAKYGITSMSAGQKVEKKIVDQIKVDIVTEDLDFIRSKVADEGISLNDNQIFALTSRKYNTGNISGFVDVYKKYNGKFSLEEMNSSDSGIWSDYMSRPITGVGCDTCCSSYLPGLGKRRVLEWILFNTGEYKTLDEIHVDDYPVYNNIPWGDCVN